MFDQKDQNVYKLICGSRLCCVDINEEIFMFMGLEDGLNKIFIIFMVKSRSKSIDECFSH